MRTIKFRGKRFNGKLKGQWVYGSLVISDPYRISIYTDDSIYNYRLVAVDRDTVGQFTGLTDYKGKEIYEGDVLSYFEKIFNVDGSFYFIPRPIRLLVFWSSDCLSFRLRDEEGYCTDFELSYDRYEVIGNIHDSDTKFFPLYEQ